MTPNRARAYGRVLSLIDDIGSATLDAGDQQAIRDAADAVLFCFDVVSDADARRTLKDLDHVLDRLVDSGRLLGETADSILGAVEACGPQTEPLLVPAVA